MKQSKKLFQKSWVLPQRGPSVEETPVHDIQVNNEGVITYCAEVVALTMPFNRWLAGGWGERSGSGFQRLDRSQTVRQSECKKLGEFPKSFQQSALQIRQ